MLELPHFSTSGKGFPFIFQHGLGASKEQAQDTLKGLKGVQLISMDCPGHGQSPLPEDRSPSFDYFTDEVLRLMDHLKIEKAIIGGISMGAGISLNMALRHPEKVAALVLVRPAWLDSKSPQNLEIITEAAKYLRSPNGKDMFEQRADIQELKNKLPDVALSIDGLFSDLQRAELPLVLKAMVEDRPFVNKHDLEKIFKPCMVIGNDDDPLHPFEMAEFIHANIVGSQLKKVISRYIDDDQHRQKVFTHVGDFINRLRGQGEILG